MSSSAIKKSIGSFLFLVMLFSAFILIRPVYTRLYTELNAYRLSVLEKLEQTAGIGLAYQSLSPSILSAFRIKNILVFDSETRKALFQIDSALFFYDIFYLIRGDMEHAFTRLIVSGVDVDLSDPQKNAKLLEFIEKFKKPESASVTDTITTATPTFSLPFDVAVRSVTVRYGDNLITGKATIKSLSYISRLGIFDEAKLQGTLSVSFTEDGKKILPEMAREAVSDFSCVFSLSGFLSPNFTGSYANIVIDSIRTQDIRVGKLNLLVEYTEEFIRVSSLQTGFPFFVTAEFFMPEKPLSFDSIRVRLQAQNLDPFSVVNITGNYPALRQIKGTTLSGLYSLVWSRLSNTVAYSANGSLRIPDQLIPVSVKKVWGGKGNGLSASYVLNGTPELLTIAALNVTAEQSEISFEGSINLKTLQPNGFADIKRFALANGNEISTTVYFDALPTGFMCFIPELFLGEKTLSALKATVTPNAQSADFSFEAYDYSHTEFETPASISLSGNFLFSGESPLQAHVSIENLFFDSILSVASFFLQPETAASLERLSSGLSPYMLTNETFISTDFSSVSYNSPYTIVANAQKDQEFVTFAFDGNEASLALSDFDMVYANQSLQASIRLDISSGFGDIFFTSDLTFNAIPYTLSGSIIPGAMIDVTGSYGFTLSVLFPQKTGENLTCFLQMEDFPIAFDKYVFALSTDISLLSDRNNEPLIMFQQIEITELTDVFSNEPRLLLAGSANLGSIWLDTISFSDAFSSLSGGGMVTWDILGNVVNSASLVVQLAAPASSEKYDANFAVENRNKTPFSLQTIQDDYYFSGSAQVNSFPSGRLMNNQRVNNTISASLSARGTLRSPYVAVQVTEASFAAGAMPIVASGTISLSDKLLRASKITVAAGQNSISDLAFDFSFDTFAGTATAFMDFHFGENSLSAPLRISLMSDEARAYNSADDSGFFPLRVPKAYTISIASGGFASTLFDKPKPLDMRITHSEGRFDVFTVNTDAVNGWLLDSGFVALDIGADSPVRFNLAGSIAQDALELDINNIAINVAPFSNLLSFPFVSVYGALMRGNAHIGGTVQNPEFSGELIGTNIELNSPNFVTEHLTAATASFIIDSNRLAAEAIPFKSNSGGVLLDIELFMDGWKFDQLALAIKTPPNSFQAANVTLSRFQIVGEGVCDLAILVRPEDVSISGSVYAQNGSFEVATAQSDDASDSSRQPQSSESSMAVAVDISATVGNRIQMIASAPGIAGLRGLVTPGTVISFRSDSVLNSTDIRGDILLRGGEIEYLSRTFYLREGRVFFDGATETLDPLVTLRAEIRESDSTGEQIRITMSATNQRLSELTATFSASPPRSETEINAILGQIILGSETDDAGQMALMIGVAGLSSFAQSAILKEMEDGLRNLLKLDIFSIRTLAFQNIVENRINRVANTQVTDAELGKPLSAGNIFDNTTVYIGRYFGSSVYFDALVHFRYDESREIIDPVSNGIVWQPEVGLEMSAPFAAIRWSIAPVFGSDEMSFAPMLVSAASVTLSWKLSW
jgi:hypothetical protein